MCSKLQLGLRAFLSLVLWIQLSGCSDFLNGKPKKQQELEIKSNELECLADSESTLKKYVLGNSNAESIRTYSVCLQKAFSLFGERTRGADQNEYTAQELYQFFSRYVIKDESFEVVLIENVLKLKSAFIGGSDLTLKKSEISKLNDLIQNLEKELILISPYAPILSFYKKIGEVHVDQVNEAVLTFRKSLGNLFQRYEFEKSNYSFQNLVHLVQSVSNLLKKPGYEKHLQLVESIKDIYFGPPMNLTLKKEWMSAVDTGVNLYSMGLRYYYLASGKSLKQKNNLKIVTDLATEFFESLKNTSVMKYQGSIAWTDIDLIIDQASELSSGSLFLKAETIKEMYRVVLRRATKAQNGSVSAESSFQRETLHFLVREFETWKNNQKDIDRVFEKQDHVEKGKFLGSLNSVLSPINQDFFKKQLNHSDAILWTPTALPLIMRTGSKIKLNWYGLTFQNMIRTMSTLLLKGYGEKESEPQDSSLGYVLAEQGLVDWYKEFDTLGKELKWFDPRSKGSGARSFKEANLFTYSADGKGQLSEMESFEFLSLLFGGGLGNTDLVQDSMRLQHCEIDELDVFGYKKFNEKCFQDNLIKSYDKLFSNLPGQVAYFNKLSAQGKLEFYQALMNASRISDPSQGKIEAADYRTIVMILLYNESLFVKFDTDLSGQLSIPELKIASLRFSEFFRALSPIKYDWFVRSLFIYIAFHGEKPDLLKLTSFEVGNYMAQLFKTEKRIDRLQLIKVFATLKEALKNGK